MVETALRVEVKKVYGLTLTVETALRVHVLGFRATP